MTTYRDIFTRHGLRCTRQRETLYAALKVTKSHPTAEELHDRVRDQDAGLSLATVYNTLDAFTAAGLIRRLPSTLGSGPCRYDADTHEHVHLTTPDGRIMDVPDDLSERFLDQLSDELVAELERRTGMRIGRVSVQLVTESR
ncbi:MAG: transcriptional repressor [Phycisphaerales bacterium]|nr:MAG: transcriptional repressor [Phycisphaerales bacterium]